MHLIPTCRPWQRQYRLWHLLATVQRELVSERTRKGRPQAHGLSPPVKRRQSQACQPEKMNPNHYSESFVWKGKEMFSLLLQEILRWSWTLLGGQAPSRSLARNPDNAILHNFLMKSPQHRLSGLSTGSLWKLLLSHTTKDTDFLHQLS